MAANSSNNTSGKSGGKQPTPSAEQVTAHRVHYNNSRTLHLRGATEPERACYKQQSRERPTPLGAAQRMCSGCVVKRVHWVVATFQRMRQEQRGMASKAAELEMEINEHSLVIDTLKEVDPSRKCFRLVGGVLVERTVREVMPALENNKEQITKIVESLNSQMQAKGRELTEYRERYNIRLVGEDDKQGKADASQAKESEGGGSKGGAGVLVS
uniref:Prefoldin subunit 2 n=1 Tax=Cyprinus carpio carpio TaxID=630221 RepID=A0A9J7ZLL6_CYPCA